MLGYLTSAAAYSLLLAAGATLWRRRLTGSGVAAALCVQLGWSLVLAAEAGGVHLRPGLSISVEYLRDLAWALVLTHCLSRSAYRRAARAFQRVLAMLSAFVVFWAAALLLLPGESKPLADYAERYGFWGMFGLSIAGLVLVEQVARNTRPAHRWQLKYVWLSIGGLFAWDLCLFSVTMLRGSTSMDFWLARGFVDALLGGVLALGLRRITNWDSAAFLSPRVVFFNATLLAASLYVLFMAAGSYYVRRLGGSWGAAGQALFLAAGALVLAVAVLSEQFRAWSRVTLAKHFFPYRYDYRSEWQKLTRALSASGETPLYDRIVRAVAGLVSSPSGGLWLKDGEGTHIPVGGDLAPADAPRESGCRAFFDYLLGNEWICDLDVARNPRPGKRVEAVPSPPSWMLSNARMWLAVPLICESALIGFVVVGQPLAAVQLSWEELDLLKAAGRQVASYLAFEQAAKRLAEAHQFEAVNRLSAVLMHDLRHLIAQQVLVVQNAARHRGNPEFFDDAILTIDNSVKRMTRLMESLRQGVLTESAHRVDVAEVCADAVRRCAGREPTPTIEVHDRGAEVMLDRERLLHAVEHVIRNAQDATAADGKVTVNVRAVEHHAIIAVTDSGVGMDAEFMRDRLFRPFDTTKGERGFGIGAYEVRDFVRKCGGSVEVESAPGRGTRFTLQLPLAPALAPPQIGMTHELQTD